MNKNHTPLQRRKIIEELTEKQILESIESINFNLKEIYIYKEMFQELKHKGVVSAGEFEEYLWKFEGEEHDYYLKFDCEIYGEINIVLKCFSLQKLYNGILIGTVQKNVRTIKEAMRITKGFRKNKLLHLEDELNQFGETKKFNMAISIKEFLVFYNLPHSDAYIELCTKFNTRVFNVRGLPNYHDILIFDSVLNELFKTNSSSEKKMQYYPILLWWRITRIIPMRPTEFYSLRRNCTMIDNEGRYWMVLPRRKNTSFRVNKIEITDTIQINQEVFDLIEEYKELTSAYESESPYLNSYQAYRKFVIKNTKGKERLRIIRGQFSNIIDRFYDDFIKPKYGDLEKVKPGDTRHFAFCNMMLQGFNMLTIARMGGHCQVETQLHYHKHLDHFAQSFVHYNAQMHRLKRKNVQRPNWDAGTQAVLAKSKVYQVSDFQEIHRVEHGYCTDHPTRCQVGDCRYCEFYYFSPEVEQKGLAWLKDASDVLERRLNEQLDLIRYVTKSMHYDFETLVYQQSGQEKLSSSCNEMRRLIDQKAMVDSYLLEDEL